MSKKPILWLIPMFLLINSCSDQLPVSSETNQISAKISPIDGHAIVTLENAEFYETQWFDELRDRLAADYSQAILERLSEQSGKAKTKGLPPYQTISLKDLQKGKAKSSGKSIGSTHIQWSDSEGKNEEFVLGIRRYIPSLVKAKNSGTQTLAANNTWLALSPDRFYLQDDDQGHELWPVTFPAVSLEDSSRKFQ